MHKLLIGRIKQKGSSDMNTLPREEIISLLNSGEVDLVITATVHDARQIRSQTEFKFCRHIMSVFNVDRGTKGVRFKTVALDESLDLRRLSSFEEDRLAAALTSLKQRGTELRQ